MGELQGVYLFGSVARGEIDARSDLDLLAIVADGRGKVPEDAVLRYVPSALCEMEASISWYGRDRLAQMFRNGELFAWHLYFEAQPLFERTSVLAALGAPAAYDSGLDDISSFQKIPQRDSLPAEGVA